MSASEYSSHAPEKDAHSGTATTGHDWDGIKELNTPMPRWWLYTFYACIVWAFGYWLVYPAWPLLWGYTHGFSGWQSRSAAMSDVADLHALRASPTARSSITLCRRSVLKDLMTNPNRRARCGGQPASICT